ncbi:sulfatase-like hydrolase/transferase [Haloglomus halophilum]|uniref:sulfatase-like hydrolase/transferase n=1 Tax=Haloglomus halophilum TaxID=2962672 RepID=UPI0020CA16D5|nr:sulfatase-like hydrolase/transferase [Haloglomus halophilum]
MLFEHAPGGHPPYGDFASGATEYSERHRNHGEHELKADYERSIELDVDLFEDRLDLLESKDVLDDTLVVYTSDHGELLGENGMVGHNSPMTPETAYVPTVFVHPDLPDGAVTDAVMSHVDLFPTILDMLGRYHDSAFDGESLVRPASSGPKCCIYNNRFVSDKFPLTDGHIQYYGIWDADGGYVFPRSNLAKRLLVLAGKTYKSPKRHYLRRNVGSLFSQYSRESRKYGDPAFSIDDAKTTLQRLNERSPVGLRQELEAANAEQLENLGYL